MEAKKMIDRQSLQLFGVGCTIGCAGLLIALTTEDYTLYLTAFILFFVWLQLLNNWAERWRIKKIKEYYATIKMPLFEVQQSKQDSKVWKRAEEHRAWLLVANNLLYIEGKIEVVEVYMNDPAIRFTEPTEEYWLRVEDFERDYLDNWAKRIAPNDERWRKVHLHNQDMEIEEKKYRFPFRLRNSTN
jgi:hypothetical protein